jgi:hypothetical protein
MLRFYSDDKTAGRPNGIGYVDNVLVYQEGGSPQPFSVNIMKYLPEEALEIPEEETAEPLDDEKVLEIPEEGTTEPSDGEEASEIPEEDADIQPLLNILEELPAQVDLVTGLKVNGIAVEDFESTRSTYEVIVSESCEELVVAIQSAALNWTAFFNSTENNRIRFELNEEEMQINIFVIDETGAENTYVLLIKRLK